MALHEEKCLRPGCNAVNRFWQQEIQLDWYEWARCVIMICEQKKWPVCNRVALRIEENQRGALKMLLDQERVRID